MIAKDSRSRNKESFRKTWIAAIKCFVLIASILIGSSQAVLHTNAASLPTKIIDYVPITITNRQGSPTPSPFQEKVTLDSSSLATLEAPNLQNVEFFSANGTVIPSWLESGNSNTATNTTYWLNIRQSIPPRTSTIVYMGFASPTTNLFDGNIVGEAPQLSPAYGQYDNGANIFAFYDNFVGTVLNAHWTNFGSDGVAGSLSKINVNNQLVLIPTMGNFYQQGTWVGATSSPSASLSKSLAADAYIAAAQPVTNFQRSACQVGCFETRFGFENVFPSNLNEGDGVGFDIANSAVLTISSGQYNQVFVTLPTTTLNQFNIYSVNYLSSITNFQVNYADVSGQITADVPPPSSQMSIFLETNYQQINGLIGWARTRAAPPNGVMPTATTGPSLQAIASAVSIQGYVPLTISMIGSAIGGRTSYSYSWTFGDGAGINAQNATHTYESAGDYRIILNVTDASGATSIFTTQVHASNIARTQDLFSSLSQWWLWAIVGLSVLSAALLVSNVRTRSHFKAGSLSNPKNDMHACPKCGGMMPPSSTFCGKCGQKFEAK